MKKYPVIKRIMSIVLALTLMFLTPTAVLAQESDSSAATITTEESESKGDLNTDSNKDSDKESDTKKDDSSVDTKENTADSSVGETDKAETSEKSKEESEKTDSSNSSSESGKDKEADKDAGVNEKKKDTKTVGQDKAEEASSECEHHEFEYKSNEDGTHTKACKECGQEFTEDCELSEEDVCQLCGYKKVVEEDKTFEIKIKDFTITAVVPAGTFDEEVEFKADEIKLSSSEKELVNDTVSLGEAEEIYAFDLRFEYDGKEVEPKEGYNVKISIESSKIDADAVVHIKDDETAEEVTSDCTTNSVTFEADSFSTFAVLKFPSDAIFYKNTAYGSGASDQRYAGRTKSLGDGGFGENRIAVRIMQKNAYGVKKDGSAYAPVDIPSGENKYFIYSPSVNDKFKFTFEAPTNYYIASVELCNWYGADNYWVRNKFVPKENYATSFSQEMSLNRMTSNHWVTNAIIIDFEPIPTELTSTYTYVNGATFVNFENGNLEGKVDWMVKTPFGNQFAFSSGQADPDSNHCHYTKVYQGLGANDITGGAFKLAQDNGVAIFPDYDKQYKGNESKYSYITEYYNDTPVQFNLDKDGYWTLDSSQYKYIYKDGKIQPQKTEKKSENQFRPFKDMNKLNQKGKTNENYNKFEDSHFGMTLPINFSVAQDGLTNGKDTIFKFSGDDDVFVYVDGKLVLDLGGIHDIIKGQINFTTGEILIQGDFANEMTSSVDDSVYFTKGIGTKNLYQIISENNVAELSQKEHVLTVVYFERGAHLSNCKISYNFKKTETRTADFTGLKVDEDHKGLAGAEFTLYIDEACTQVATIGIGSQAVAVSDEKGTIQFKGLSAGVIEENHDSVSKTYYLKETKAPEGYNTPVDAKWRLDFTVYKDLKKEPIRKLTALNDEAAAISLNQQGNYNRDDVKAIENILTKHPKKLSVVKKVTYGSDNYTDDGAVYKFKIEEVVFDGVEIYKPLENQPYTVAGKEFKTDNAGQFTLKANETALFENLLGTKYQITEVEVVSEKGYTLDNYETKISIDGNVTVGHVAIAAYVAAEDKAVEFENILNKVFDWQLIKVSNSGKTLKGAEFTLTSDSQGQTATYYGKSDEKGLVKWYATEKNRKKGKNPTEIPVGSYILKETKAPNGYALSTDAWHITIDNKNGTEAYIEKNGDLGERTTVEETNIANGVVLKTVKLTFENEIAYTLPETGGSGTYIFTISGVLVMIGAALLLYKQRKVKRSNKEKK